MRNSSELEEKLEIPQTDPLLEKDGSINGDSKHQQKRKGHRPLLAILLLSCLVNVLLLVNIFHHERPDVFPMYFYSPVRDLLTFHPRLFTIGLGNDTTAYQGPPSPAKQAAWNGLYRKFLRIPRELAVQLNNKTIPLPQSEQDNGSDEEFGVGIMVFHNLHCLHYIAEALDVFHYPSYYGLNSTFNPFDGIHTKTDFNMQQSLPSAFLDVLHIEHCIDLLRQALMCNADITPYVFQEAGAGSGVIGTVVQTVHMCADFPALRNWAAEREFDGDFIGANMSGAVGRCGPQDAGCGEEFGEGEWRARNRWMNSDPWTIHGGV